MFKFVYAQQVKYYLQEGAYIMAKKQYRITNQGYVVIALLLIIVIVILIIAIAKTCAGGGGDSVIVPTSAPTFPVPEGTPYTPDETIAPYTTTDPDGTPEVQSTVAPWTNAPGTPPPNATTKPATPPPDAWSTPSAKMINGAVSGVVSKSDVKMRKGPGTQYDTVLTGLAKNTKLTVYAKKGDWYFVKVNSQNKYGYIRSDMVKLDAALGSGATAEPKTPEGTVKGTLTALVVLRKTPKAEDTNKIKQFEKGTVVYIYYKEGDYYYVQVAGSGEKGYMAAKFIKASDTVPSKPKT